MLRVCFESSFVRMISNLIYKCPPPPVKKGHSVRQKIKKKRRERKRERGGREKEREKERGEREIERGEREREREEERDIFQ